MAKNVYQTIINAESGGRNIMNTSDPAHSSASGYFQMLDSTFQSTSAGQNSGVTRAMDAPYATQQAAAGELIQRNGLRDWAPYDGIDPNLSHYDTTPLSGPGGQPANSDPTGGAGNSWNTSQGINPNEYPGYTGNGGQDTSISGLAGQNSTSFNNGNGTLSPNSIYAGYDPSNPYGNLTGANGNGLAPSGNTAQMAGLPAPDMLGNDSTGGAGTSVSAGTPGNPSTTPVAIVTGDAQQAQAIANAATTAAKTATADQKAQDQTATTVVGGFSLLLADGAVRIALVAAGLLLLAGAFWLITSEQGASAMGSVDKFARKVPFPV